MRLIMPLLVVILLATSTMDAAAKRRNEATPLCIPVDQRVWRPLDNLLPSNQAAVHFVPEPSETRWLLGEHISIEKGPRGSKVGNMTIGAPDSEVIEAAEKNNELLVVLKDKKDGRFRVVRTMQGPDAAYTVSYVSSDKGLSPSELSQWHGRIENIKFGGDKVDSNCLLLSALGVYRDGEQVKASEAWSHYEHSTRPFACSLPSSWIAAEVCNYQKLAIPAGADWIEYLSFTRSDNMVYGGIFSVKDGPYSQEAIDRNFADSVKYVHGRDGFEVIEYGDFPTETGHNDKYVVVKQNSKVCMKRFHYRGNQTYRIDAWAHERDYPLVKGTFLQVMNGFESFVRSDSSARRDTPS